MRQATATSMHMASCEWWLEAVSALADGEDPGIDARLVEAHVARCSRCWALRDRLDQLPGRERPGPAEPMPDLSRRIVALNAVADRASRWAIVRWLLAAVAMVIIVLSFRSLAAEADIGSGHSMRHLGAFTLAYGVALLLVVARPARARTVLPVAATLAVALAISGVVDIVDGRVPLASEAMLHLPEIISVALIWLLAAPSRLRDGPSSRRDHEPPSLQIVEDPPPEEPGTRAI